MKLIKYRDSGMHTYTYFWVNDRNQVVSPYFSTDTEATKWLKEIDDECQRDRENSKPD